MSLGWTDKKPLDELIMTQFNLSPPSAVYMRQWIGSALFQIMACRLFGAKPLSKSMLGYCQLDKLKWNFNFADDIFRCIFMNEKFCILAAILSQRRWVNYAYNITRHQTVKCISLKEDLKLAYITVTFSVNITGIAVICSLNTPIPILLSEKLN